MTEHERNFLSGVMGMSGDHFCDVTRVAYMLVCRFRHFHSMAGLTRAIEIAEEFVSAREANAFEIATVFGRPYFARGGEHQIRKHEAEIIERSQI